MDLSKEFAEIEEPSFTVYLYHASRLSMLFDLAEQSPAVQRLQKALTSAESRKQVLERIRVISARMQEKDKASDFDIVLAVYLHLLYSRSNTEGEEAAKIISQLENCYWAEMLSSSILFQPTKEERNLFWREISPQLAPQDDIFVVKGYVQAESVRDIRGQSIAAFAGLSGKAALFFVDRNPAANWAHDCWYVLLLLEEQRLVKAEHRMPLPDEFELCRLNRVR
jgi:hypothetical protein